MLRLLKKSDPRITAFAVITLFAVLFSIFKAAGALTVDEPAPDYRKSPPKAFAVPIAEMIVDPELLREPRLPDEAYDSIINNTRGLTARIMKQKLTVKYLVGLGMTSRRASAVLTELAGYYPIYNGRKVRTNSRPTVGSVSPDIAKTFQSVQFGSSQEGPGGTFTAEYSFSSKNGLTWTLTGVNLSF